MRELHERGVKCAIASSSYRELIDELVGIAGIADAGLHHQRSRVQCV
ncbi:MAG: hypothetical protein ACLTXI_09730 [Collinsella sp.]